MEERISAASAALLIGIKTRTLAKWRWQGRGPRGWVRISATHVTYARVDVERFIADQASQTTRPS